MDKFPEAYKRFEKKVDLSDVNSFQQLLKAFQLWGDKKAPATRLQKRALAVEGKKDGIEPTETRRIVHERKEISYTRKDGRQVNYIRKGRIVNQTVDIITGRFVKSETDGK